MEIFPRFRWTHSWSAGNGHWFLCSATGLTVHNSYEWMENQHSWPQNNHLSFLGLLAAKILPMLLLAPGGYEERHQIWEAFNWEGCSKNNPQERDAAWPLLQVLVHWKRCCGLCGSGDQPESPMYSPDPPGQYRWTRPGLCACPSACVNLDRLHSLCRNLTEHSMYFSLGNPGWKSWIYFSLPVTSAFRHWVLPARCPKVKFLPRFQAQGYLQSALHLCQALLRDSSATAPC